MHCPVQKHTEGPDMADLGYQLGYLEAANNVTEGPAGA
jgi:hypothetical protein